LKVISLASASIVVYTALCAAEKKPSASAAAIALRRIGKTNQACINSPNGTAQTAGRDGSFIRVVSYTFRFPHGQSKDWGERLGNLVSGVRCARWSARHRGGLTGVACVLKHHPS